MIYVRKVLVEKYSYLSMLNWISKQKYISVRALKYSDAAELRDMELFLYNKFPFNSGDVIMYKNERFDTAYFKLFETM